MGSFSFSTRDDCKYINEKYYSGFEGEEEFIFFTADSEGRKRGYGIWCGYTGAVTDRGVRVHRITALLACRYVQ